jgi:hypothetical protein
VVDILATCCLLCLGAGPVGAPEHPWKHLTPDQALIARRLQADFDASLQLKQGQEIWHQALVRKSKSGESWQYYNLQLGLDPLLTMYEATHYEPYLEMALSLCQNMVGAANQDRDGDQLPEWDGRRNGKQVGNKPDTLLYDFQGACPLARAARIVLADPHLETKYGARARALAHFVDKLIIDKWMQDRKQLNYWKNPKRWLDKMAMLVRMELDLHAATGDEKHREMAKFFARMLADRFTRYVEPENLYLWITPARDTQHSNRLVTMAIYCYEADLVYTRKDLERITNTFLKRVWDGSMSQPRFHNFHDGSNGPIPGRPQGPWHWGEIYDGWIKLGRYDSHVQDIGMILWDQVKRRQWDNPSAKRHSSPWARMALPANLLYNLVYAEYYKRPSPSTQPASPESNHP